MRTNLLYATVAALALVATPALANAQSGAAGARRCAANTVCDKVEDRRDRREDVRDRAEDRRDVREDVRDRREDVRDRSEDRRERRRGRSSFISPG